MNISKPCCSPCKSAGHTQKKPCPSSLKDSPFQPEVVYGPDDRVDIHQVKDEKVLKDADSVVALYPADKIVDNGDGTSSLKTEKFGDAYRLCEDEPFREQPTGAFCSGFLVGPDLIATAGHCVDNGVANTKFVFGYQTDEKGVPTTIVQNSEVYSAKEVIGEDVGSDGADWALVRLDRPVENHNIVTVRDSGKIDDGQAVHVIGHPAGIPKKYAPGANVRDNNRGAYFVANLDTYGGNSGSPVFNSETHEVEGILVRGATDFKWEGSCRVSNECPDTGCRGEDVTRASVFSDLLKEATKEAAEETAKS